MTLKAIRALFTPGQIVTVTNHYLTREDHPCYGTHQRTIARVSGSHLHFIGAGALPWPKAAQIEADPSTVRLYGGGIGQAPGDLFLTITL